MGYNAAPLEKLIEEFGKFRALAARVYRAHGLSGASHVG